MVPVQKAIISQEEAQNIIVSGNALKQFHLEGQDYERLQRDIYELSGNGMSLIF